LTVLERAGGEIFVLYDAGDIVGGKDSLGQLCRWIRQGTTTTWIKEVIPGGNGVIPMAMSASGNAMVGDVFIWTPEINEGNVLNLNDHLFNLGATWLGEYRIYNPLGPAVWDISDDATKILIRGSDDRSLCLNTFSSALIDLTGSTACVPAQMILDPVSDTAVAPAPGYYPYGVILNCMAGGTWPLNYQWQKENESGEWVDLYDDVYCNSTYAGASFDVKAPTTSQLRLGFLSGTWRGRYRCVVSNACGQVISDVARVGSCPADYNFDGGVDGDDVISYFADWDAANPDADFTGDGGVDGDDVIVFFSRWDQSC
ncbi:MAG: GC-type dockerin domain-anchored protein, partial [bacterium]